MKARELKELGVDQLKEKLAQLNPSAKRPRHKPAGAGNGKKPS